MTERVSVADYRQLQKVINDVGPWASAIQDDPQCCAELKHIFLRLLTFADADPNYEVGHCLCVYPAFVGIKGEPETYHCEMCGYHPDPDSRVTVKLTERPIQTLDLGDKCASG